VAFKSSELAFLKEVLLHTENNKVTIDKLAVVFACVLIRAPPMVSSTPGEIQRKAEFLMHFLKAENELFLT